MPCTVIVMSSANACIDVLSGSGVLRRSVIVIFQSSGLSGEPCGDPWVSD